MVFYVCWVIGVRVILCGYKLDLGPYNINRGLCQVMGINVAVDRVCRCGEAVCRRGY